MKVINKINPRVSVIKEIQKNNSSVLSDHYGIEASISFESPELFFYTSE
jgi:hypothetical protein